jgi:uncharacterized damage-inducible protein DinB
MTAPNANAHGFITPDALLKHWHGHRALTRRMIELFPEDQLFTFSLGGMRTFGAFVREMLGMAAPTVQGVATNEWVAYSEKALDTRAGLLQAWDESTTQMNAYWAQIPPARFHETMTAFGQWTMVGHDLVLYIIDNEIHHRGQGYVYLRALGIEPPPFYERG